jgi:hypothetical protein
VSVIQTRLPDRAMKPQNNTSKRLKVAIVAPRLLFIGGQSVQADLLFRLWHGDSDIEAVFVVVDPPLPRSFAWARRIRGVRTIPRAPFYINASCADAMPVSVIEAFRSGTPVASHHPRRCRTSSNMNVPCYPPRLVTRKRWRQVWFGRFATTGSQSRSPRMRIENPVSTSGARCVNSGSLGIEGCRICFSRRLPWKVKVPEIFYE